MNRYLQLEKIVLYLTEKFCDLQQGVVFLHPWFLKELNEYAQASNNLWTGDVVKLEVQNPPTNYSWYYQDGDKFIFSYDSDDQKMVKLNETL